MPDRKQKRVFWLGMHVVLTQTELPRLRALGYEVFNPPYLSNLYDQSTNQNWDSQQETTLPREVFEKLAKTRFFYHKLSREVGEILNEYFGTIIVTISPLWLKEVLKVYRGRIIFRTYGQTGALSDTLLELGMFRAIQERDDFWFVPHAEETAEDEHDWLKDRMKIVPYGLPSDVFRFKNTWSHEPDHLRQIMVTCPNIENHAYAKHYQYLKKNFPGPHFRLYGVQPKKFADPRIVGTLPREELLQHYQRSAGYFYTYRDPHVCYLPPIEMMTVGGPILYLSESLLHRYFKTNTPGRCRDEFEAQRKIKWLLRPDPAFIAELIESQKQVRTKYDPDYVNPLFDSTFQSLIDKKVPNRAMPVILDRKKEPSQTDHERIYIFFHFPVAVLKFVQGQYSSSEGIPRVIRKLVDVLIQKTSYQIVITCLPEQVALIHGFFSMSRAPERFHIQVVDPVALTYNYGFHYTGVITETRRFFQRCRNFSKRMIKKAVTPLIETLRSHIFGSEESGKAGIINAFQRFKQKQPSLFIAAATLIAPFAVLTLPLLILLYPVYRIGRAATPRIKRLLTHIDRKFCGLAHRLSHLYHLYRHVQQVNRDPAAKMVVIPHYHWFPDALFLKKNTILYLPDYMPHFFDQVAFDGRRDRRNAWVGKKLAAAAKAVFANSEFTQKYLPDTVLQVDPRKIHVLPMPLLMGNTQKSAPEDDNPIQSLLKGMRYVFYPTQNRPNKNLDFLLQVFNYLRSENPELKLVLTCRISDHPPAENTYKRLNLQSSVYFFHGVVDSDLSWLYKNAALCCFTSTMEGNFPPQVLESLHYETPVVATRLPLITDALGDLSEKVLLCDPLDPDDFIRNSKYALENPQSVKTSQRVALEYLMKRNSDSQFSEAVKKMVYAVSLTESTEPKLDDLRSRTHPKQIPIL